MASKGNLLFRLRSWAASGFACQGLGRRESAEEYFRLSLELDPLLWVSVAALCELGTDLDVTGNFR